MKKKSILSFLFIVSFIFQGFSQAKPTSWKFSLVDKGNGEIELVANATIAAGWHLYDTKIPEGGPYATSLSIDKVEGAVAVGKFEATKDSKLISGYDAIFDMNIGYFDNEAKFVQRFKVTDKAKFMVGGDVRAQSCNDAECTPPLPIDFSFKSADLPKTVVAAGAASAATKGKTKTVEAVAKITEVAAPRHSVVGLTVKENFKAIQWEISSDNNTWYSIKNATQKDYGYKLTAPAYVRAKQMMADNSIVYSGVTHAAFDKKNVLKKIKSSGGQGYAEVDGEPAGGIRIREDRGPDGKLRLDAYSDGWTNAEASLTWYLYHTAGEYDIDMVYSIDKGATQQFEFSIIDINSTGLDEVQSIVSTTGTGVNETLTVLNVNVPKTGFYKYELKPLSPPNNRVKIVELLFKSLTSASADVHATNYLSSPSVHLGNWRSTDPAAVAGSKYDWCYQEILVPTGGDALSTYYMSLGVLDGYMGIQTNSESQRGVIFSMWDDGDTDSDPTLDQQKRAGAVDADPKTTVSRFGNEGTGTKSFVHGWNWDTNEPVKFLTNARLEAYNDTLKNVMGQDSVVFRENTLVSAWFNSSTTDGWQYISTLRLPNKISYFNSWYSFLENYGYTNGQVRRYAYYYNAFAREQSSDPKNPGSWINMNKVNFSNTDGAAGQRTDFEQGRLPENPDYFYMSSGGYANEIVKTENTTNLKTDKSAVESLDLDKLLERVDEAVAKEKKKNDALAK